MLTFIVTAIACCVVALYLYRKLWVHRYFKRLGIPGPEPHWLFGNLMELSGEGDIHLKLAEWSRKHGKIYGYYEGPSPVVVISDVDEVANVFVKQFATFHGRKMFHYQPDPDDMRDAVSLLFARGERWKRLRTIINPAFSSKKLRQMTPQMMQYQRYFMDLLAKKSKDGQEFNIFDCFQLLTMDTIGECAFGIALNSVRSEGRDNPTLKKIQEMFQMTFKLPKISILTMVLTELKPIFNVYVQSTASFSISILNNMYWLYGVIEKLITDRKQMSGKGQAPQDMMQLMLDLEKEDGANQHGTLKALSPEELKAQVWIFLVAGYETTSNALAFAANMLAVYPDKQQRLLGEIVGKFGDGKAAIDYDAVNALPYLDAVVNETLRMFPVGVLVTNRMAMEETQIGGYQIPQGLPIQADIVSIHNDPALWGPVDSELFHPERWLPDYPTANRPEASFLSFGFGPRTCIGNRFALLEMKLTLVNMLLRYTIRRCDRTEEKLQLKVAHTMTPKNGVWVKLEQRQQEVKQN